MSKNRNRYVPNPLVKEPPVNNDTTDTTDSSADAEQEMEHDSADLASEDAGSTAEQTEAAVTQDTQPAAAAPAAAKPTEDVKDKSAAKPTPQPEGFTPVFKVELDLNNYAEAMAKAKAINPEEGGKWQYSLYATLKAALNAPDQETFNKEWSTILNFFHKNKSGIFNENYIFRFPAQWPGSATEFTSFRRVVYMLIQTADPKTRTRALRDINMELVCEGMSQVQRNHLFSFYNV